MSSGKLNLYGGPEDLFPPEKDLKEDAAEKKDDDAPAPRSTPKADKPSAASLPADDDVPFETNEEVTAKAETTEAVDDEADEILAQIRSRRKKGK